MKYFSFRLLIFLAITLNAILLWTAVDAQEPSQECLQETAPLLSDETLQIAQQVVLEDYNASFYDRCRFGFSGVGCDIRFEGDDRTYNALCAAAGGQIYERPVVLSCAFGAVQHDLGFIPTCVGASCNVTAEEVGPSNVETQQVEEFLESLKLTGCSAESSGAVAVGMKLMTMMMHGGTLILLLVSVLFVVAIY